MNIVFLKKIRLGMHLGRILGRFGRQKGSQKALKWDPKRSQHRSENMMDFLIDFEPVLEAPPPGQPRKVLRAGAVEWGRGEA